MMELTAEYVRECLKYRDGKLFWRDRPASHFKTIRGCSVFRSSFAGKEAGYENSMPSGHRWYVRLDGILYLRSRIIFLIHNGFLPIVVDHVNRNQLDDRIENLRAATHSNNHANAEIQSNSTSGLKGVSFDKRRGKWRSYIKKNGKHFHLGVFDDPNEAHAAYVAKAVEFFGEFAFSG